MNSHHRSSNLPSTIFGESTDLMAKKTPSPRRQTTRSSTITTTSTTQQKDLNNIQIIKPVAVRPPSSDSSQTPYNLRSRTRLKNPVPPTTSTTTTATTTTTTSEVIPSFTEKLSLETTTTATTSTSTTTTTTTQSKPVPPLTRAAAASAGLKLSQSTKINSTISTRSSTTRKRKASEDDHRPYLDLLKMKQTQSTYSFDGNSPKKMTRRADQDCLGLDDEDSGCDYDSPSHSPVDFTDVPPGHVFHFEESNMSYDSGFSTGSAEAHHDQPSHPRHCLTNNNNNNNNNQTSQLQQTTTTTITTRSSSQNKFSVAIDLDVNAIEGDLGF